MKYQSNLQKIGVMIHRCRLRRQHSSDRNDFMQSGFLISSIRHPFFDIRPGYPVCSRATLLKLENGKAIREEELYRFFLRKLDLSYVYSPLREAQYKTCFSAFDAIITEGSLAKLDQIALPAPAVENLLYGFYDRLIHALLQYYTSAIYPNIETMEEFSELWFCIPQQIRPITAIFMLSASDAHPFFDRIDIGPILRKFPSHPLEILACDLVALGKARYLLSARLTDRFNQTACSGELPLFLTGLIRCYTNSILSRAIRPAPISIEAQSHPLDQHFQEILVFHLGKQALEQHEFKQACIHFSKLENRGIPFGIYASLVLNHPYHGDLPHNPKLKCLSDYLYAKESLGSQQRLAILIGRILPAMDVRTRFILVFLRSDVAALVQCTQRYKSAYLFLRCFDPLDND